MMDAPSGGASDRANYYAQSASWAADRERTAARSERLAWIIALVAVAVALLEAIALAALAPLKTTIPYTVLVDRHTGFAQMLKGADVEPIKADAALTQSLLAQYVISRESFDISTVANEYRKVALWSADTARRDYLTRMPASNPDSPFRRYQRTSIVATRIKSVSQLNTNTALIRFSTERIDQGEAGGIAEDWVAVIRYQFIAAPQSIEDRLVNPLGFQVIRYRRDQEAPPPQTIPNVREP